MSSKAPAGATWWSRNRQYVALACAATAAGVAAYQLVLNPRVHAARAALQRAADTLDKYSNAAASAGEALAILSADIRQFLASDADELPPSLRQLGKLARSQELQDTLAACVASAVKGMLASGSPGAGSSLSQPSMVDNIIEAVLSDRGQSLVGLAVRTAAQMSSETFCAALRTGIDAAVASSSSSSGHQQQHQDASPTASPQCHQQQHRYHSPSRHQQHPPGLQGLHPAAATLVAVLGNPQVLSMVDALVSTTVGSAVGAYIRQAGQESMLTSFMDTLSKPGNKEVIIEVMSSVSAAFCREAAAACVAPASAVASPRPPPRLQQPQPQPLLQQAAGTAAGRSSSPLKQLQPRQSQDSFAAAAAGCTAAAAGPGSEDNDVDDNGSASRSSSEPSTPQSGPSTPEPSLAAEPATTSSALRGFASRSSFAGSAVAGLILRRNSFPGMGGGWGCGSGASSASGSAGGGAAACIVDPAALGPMSTLVSLFVQAARFQEFRSLMVDVSRSSTREFVLSLLPASWGLAARSGSGSGGVLASAALTAALYRVYSAMSVLLFLMVYALGPKTLEQ